MIDPQDFQPVPGESSIWLHPDYGRCIGRDGQTLESFIVELEASLAAIETEQPEQKPVDRIAELEARVTALEEARRKQ